MKYAALAVLVAMLAMGQDATPRWEQCRADANLWWTRSSPEMWSRIAALPQRELERREAEMNKCSLANQDDSERYSVVAEFYRSAQLTRLQSFLFRHPDIREHFYAEDEAGKR